jgi:hypothetical protein
LQRHVRLETVIFNEQQKYKLESYRPPVTRTRESNFPERCWEGYFYSQNSCQGPSFKVPISRGQGLEEEPLSLFELLIVKVSMENEKFAGSPFNTICARLNRLQNNDFG